MIRIQYRSSSKKLYWTSGSLSHRGFLIILFRTEITPLSLRRKVILRTVFKTGNKLEPRNYILSLTRSIWLLRTMTVHIINKWYDSWKSNWMEGCVDDIELFTNPLLRPCTPRVLDEDKKLFQFLSFPLNMYMGMICKLG